MQGNPFKQADKKSLNKRTRKFIVSVAGKAKKKNDKRGERPLGDYVSDGSPSPGQTGNPGQKWGGL